MSVWDDHEMTDAVVGILSALPLREPDHHFGRPWLTAYQLSVEVERLHPEAFAAFGDNPGGAGSGSPFSVPQRLARELSGRIKNDPLLPIEGADLCTLRVGTLTFVRGNGEIVESSQSGSDPLAMFRYRH